MKYSKIENIIIILYFLYAILFLLTNYLVLDVYDLIGLILAVIFLFFFKRIKINSKFFVSILTLAIIIRFLLIFIPYRILENDYQFFYSNAVAFAKGQIINNRYIALFPYLYLYVASLGMFMEFFYVSYKSVIIFNMIFELLGALFFYLIAKNN